MELFKQKKNVIGNDCKTHTMFEHVETYVDSVISQIIFVRSRCKKLFISPVRLITYCTTCLFLR